MNIDALRAWLQSMNDAMPNLMAAEQRATEARLRQEGAIMAVRDLLRAGESAAQQSDQQENVEGTNAS
jgi:hypothetical protein